MSIEDFALTLELDPDKDGTWGEDITAYFYNASIMRGRRDALSKIQPGTMMLSLNNRDGRFSPDKAVIADLDNFTPIRLYDTWTTPAITNLIENPSLETNADGWTGGAVRDTAQSWAGLASARLDGTAGTDDVNVRRIDGTTRISITAGLVYTFRFRVRVTGGSSTWQALILWYDVASGLISADTSGPIALVGGGDWVEFPALIGTAPVGAVTADLSMIETSGSFGVGESIYFDAAMFYQSADTTIPYVDGRQPGCTWAGTADASQSSRSANPTFFLFQGFIVDFNLKEDVLNQAAEFLCVDRMALWSQIRISNGNIMNKPIDQVLELLIAKIEGNLIRYHGLEYTDTGINPLTGYSALGGASLVEQTDATLSQINVMEGDASIKSVNLGGGAGEGWRYDATTDIAATGTYRLRVWAKCESGTLGVTFRFLRDAVVEATKNVTLTTTFQLIDLGDVVLATLGTNRYLELFTTAASAIDVFSDELQAVKAEHVIKRDFEAGQETLILVNAFHDPAGPIIADVVSSEPGLMFVKAGSLADGDEIAFRNQDSRPAAVIPRANFGDGDGLLLFADGLNLTLGGADRIGEVLVTSRGSPTLGGTPVPLWNLAPRRDVTNGDEFPVRFQQSAKSVAFASKGSAATVEHRDRQFGIGIDIEITATGALAFFAAEGRPLEFPSEWSSIRKTADTGLPIQTQLPVPMPYQGTLTTAMENEAQRLIDKYKNRVRRVAMPLNQRDDGIQAFQLDLEINDAIVVRAESQDHSPGFDKTFWVEGIQHDITGRGEIIKTTILAEEL